MPLAATNWRLRVFGRRRRLVDPGVVSGNQVRSTTAPFGLPTTDNFVSYSAGIPDLVGVNGAPVEPFSISVDIAPPLASKRSPRKRHA